MNRVLVAESGAKPRTIKGFLGGDFDIVASGGHIVDLPDDNLGIDIEGEFAFDVVPIPRRGGDSVFSNRVVSRQDSVVSYRVDAEGVDEVAVLRNEEYGLVVTAWPGSVSGVKTIPSGP